MSEWFFADAPASGIPVDDRSWLYGDGLFETIAIRDGRPRLLDWHLERLSLGCRRIGIVEPGDGDLLESLETALSKTSLDLGYALGRLVVTAGQSPRGYARAGATANVYVGLFSSTPPDPRLYHEGCRVRMCSTRLARQPQLAGLKTLNRLEQVLARAEWQSSSHSPAQSQPTTVFEGLCFDTEEQLICGTMSNVFIVRGERLMTPDLSQSGVAGVMRRLLLEICSEHRQRVEVLSVDQPALAAADEVFLCNSQFGIVPVTTVEHPYGDVSNHAAPSERRLPIGRVTRGLMDILRRRGYAEIVC